MSDICLGIAIVWVLADSLRVLWHGDGMRLVDR